MSRHDAAEGGEKRKTWHATGVAEGTQQFEKEPSYTEVNPRGEATLHCRIFNLMGECSWQKDGLPTGIYPGKYEWAGDREKGDCSLKILNADLNYDDGEWKCQVTASAFTLRDALTSTTARLVVRVPPNSPQIEYKTHQVIEGNQLSAQELKPATVKCISRFGNPPAGLRWFIGEEDVTKASTQRNFTETEDERKWRAESVLEYTFNKEDHEKKLRCLAFHEAYDARTREVQLILDIQYAPIVRLEGIPQQEVEENVDDVSLHCKVDSNPPGNIVWRKSGHESIFSFSETLDFRPVVRDTTGTYVCEAKNNVGESKGLTATIDVKYAPVIKRYGPSSRKVSAALGNETILTCEAESNPPPSYQWLQKPYENAQVAYIRGRNATLRLTNLSYEHQGLYACSVANVIKGRERKIQSEAIALHVRGAPQFLPSREAVVTVARGEDAELSLTFCADPEPRSMSWEWGSLALEMGSWRGKYHTQLLPDRRQGCHEAKLTIKEVEMVDARKYTFLVKNEHGEDSSFLELHIKEQVTITTVIGIVIGCALVLVLALLLLLYAFKAEKWCFSQRGDFKPSDITTELEKGGGQKNGRGLVGGKGPGSGGAIPPDALYAVPHKATSDHDKSNGEGGKNIIYADLQLPRSSNNGSMRIRPSPSNGQQQQQIQHGAHRSPTEYAQISFQRADV
ncbi:unnamed protein product [Darwinula stevensoni]|uniref:Ig-like domain-containing protein n=1 Tax=Darwinula stevensoni TaxID=69355 RepID=A0A7R8X2D5_9CRUS|nr:unnamed protein product [Darwinula stevensoni]CAG0881330.1 unnamed protein product [Darwinula stevensoni]